jgi:tetratricopeptide (TPR) repeat protein
MLLITMITNPDAAIGQTKEEQRPWQPKIVRLATSFSSRESRRGQGLGWTGVIKPILPAFVESLEVKPIRHAEKLFYYYAWLLFYSDKAEEGHRWLEKCIQTPYNRVEAMAMMRGLGKNTEQERLTWRRRWQRAILQDYPISWEWISEMKPLNRTILLAAQRALWDESNVPKEDRLFGHGDDDWSPWGQFKLITRVGELYEEMGDYKRAANAYQNADICIQIDTALRDEYTTSHPAWEKLATLYEKIGDWDMALHWRLKQLAALSEVNVPADIPQRFDVPKRTKQLTDKIIYLLARIGAGEPVDPPPAPLKHDLEKLRLISQHYCDMGYPTEGMKMVQFMEQIAQKELTEDRARVWESTAWILSESTATPKRLNRFWVVLWDQVWTYDKVVAVHKQAIEWGKKAGWEEARLKKLEDQITKLPDLLKYVKEPKNFQDLLEGKTTEPKW